jgi:hypothetical protein
MLSTLMTEVEMSVLTRAMWHHVPEDVVLHRHCRENLKPYI